MTGDKSKLTDFMSKEEGYVTFGWEKEILEISTRHRKRMFYIFVDKSITF